MEPVESRGGVVPAVEGVVADARATVEHAADAIKPRLRGWLHAGTVPAFNAAGSVLIALAPRGAHLPAAVYVFSVLALFGTSATYHRGRWSPRVRAALQRLDHSMIFVLIAGTYTPFATLGLDGETRVVVLSVVWTGALSGAALQLFFDRIPRWLFVALYLLLGWVGVAVLGDLLDGVGVTSLVLIIVGGVLYTLGAGVYAFKRPDPSPAWFGFHEVFHAFTIAAAIVHYVAVSLVVYRS